MIFLEFEPILCSLIALHYNVQADDLPESVKRHQELLDAIRNKDEELASHLTREIISQGISVIETQYDWANH